MLFADRGASVVVNDLGCELDATGRSTQPADETVEAIRARGGVAVASYDSVATKSGADKLIGAAMDTFGGVDIIVNNAGVQIIVPFGVTDESVVRRHVDVHLLGTFLVSQAAWPHLLASPAPRIVNTTSMGVLGLNGYSAYSAAKAAVVGLTRTMAVEARGTKIRVNAIAPAGITRMVDAHYAGIHGAGVTEEMRSAMPTSFVAPVVVFLCHSSCDLSGEILAAGGGHVSRMVLAETTGIADQNLTPESVAAHIEQIMDDRTSVTLPDSLSRPSALAKYR
jgi:hypothetical protein